VGAALSGAALLTGSDGSSIKEFRIETLQVACRTRIALNHRKTLLMSRAEREAGEGDRDKSGRRGAI
jgi:hypothetical protein